MGKERKDQYYTLLEIAVAVAVLALLSSIVIISVGRISITLTMDNFSSSLQGLFASASFMAQSSGEPVEIIFDPDLRCFKISGKEKAYTSEIFSVEVPEKLNILFDKKEKNKEFVLYKFYPDGSASGGAFEVRGGDKKLNFFISSLSGILTVRGEKK